MKIISLIILFLGLLNFHQAIAKILAVACAFLMNDWFSSRKPRTIIFIKNNDENAYLVQADIAIPDESTGLNAKSGFSSFYDYTTLISARGQVRI